MKENHTVYTKNAELFAKWIAERGGLALWRSVDLSDLDKQWTTPVKNEDGTPKERPHWKSDTKPYRVITTTDEVDVITPLEVKRFRVAIRLSGNGMAYKVTDAGTRRIRAAVSKAAANRADKTAWYEFDYGTQEAVIYVPGKRVNLTRYLQEKMPKVS